MTTPDTSAVRAWARSNGYDVADRGRLPADVTDAYVAAHGKRSTAAPATGKPAARKATTTRPAAKKKAATAPDRKSPNGRAAAADTGPAKTGPAKPAAAKRGGRKAVAAKKAAPQKAAQDDGGTPTPPVDVAANQAPAADTGSDTTGTAAETRGAPEPKPSPVSDDRRLVALGEQLQALTERVAALEATVAKSNGKSGAKQSRFRRSR